MDGVDDIEESSQLSLLLVVFMSGWVDAENSSWADVELDDPPNSISCEEDGVGALHMSREVSIKGGMYYNIIDEITMSCVGL